MKTKRKTKQKVLVVTAAAARAARDALDVTAVQVERQPLASGGLEGWPRTVRLLATADRALRSIGNVPREERKKR